ncbi:2-amino-4-hydroxy-6-hydroxymethyldihydropteridine diphosphokinase [Hydrogenophaga sp.]|uniref:2-amino-4-hydroxy-6- hydroxymethyldihydropteridine diphosphokinase n=1 Tax=Hydrogenophaga sp. TaxID=1904254 RepID=UPI0019BA16CB|nr:2-amino-4-hydroxy-6-hydroxymethyldihydropteridine diphosphokinase [Hydrogenophaga sp.]MBD3893335.1 2-amino-4-hydroxy-6-hydroxymethyldihydropteridine diphosphokinase [Hydrogenophaga sp.]
MRRDPVTAFVALGANLGDPEQALRHALAALVQTAGVQLLQASSQYRSAPIDASGPHYHNAVAAVSTTLSAPELLTALQTLEQQAGRQRAQRNAPRTLDLDLLLFGSARIESPWLTVPHPRMWSRAFVLLPLAELAPEWVSEQQLQAVRQQVIERLANGPDALV